MLWKEKVPFELDPPIWLVFADTLTTFYPLGLPFDETIITGTV